MRTLREDGWLKVKQGITTIPEVLERHPRRRGRLEVWRNICTRQPLSTGQTVEGSMDGKDEEAIIHGLHQLGYIPIRIISPEETGTGFRLPSFLPQRVGVKDLLTFTQELSTLISAGLPLDRSLQYLRDAYRK